MGNRWMLGVVAALTAVCLAGVGFAAFTAQATVNGVGTAGSIGLDIISTGGLDCGSLYGATASPTAGLTFFDLSADLNSVSVRAVNLTPGVYCEGYLELENPGSVPVQVSVALNTPGTDGICTAYAVNCFDVETISGIEATGWEWYTASPSAGTSCYAYSDFTTLSPGGVFWDNLAVNIPHTSTYSSTPGSSEFTIVYTASTGA